MPLFGVYAAAASPTAAFDAIELLEPGTGLLRVTEFRLWQTSDVGDAAEEVLAVEWIIGHTTSGSAGAATIASGNALWDAADTFTAEGVNTTIASVGTTRIPWATGWNIRIPLEKIMTPDEARDLFCLRNGERGVFRVSAPGDAITVRAYCQVMQE